MNNNIFEILINFKNKSFFVFVPIVILTLFIISLGQTARWDILDHVSMADSYNNSNSLYPNQKDIFLHGASVYFPGISIIALLLKNITFKYLIYCMQIFAITMILILYYIQKEILSELNVKLSNRKYFYLTTFFYFILNYEWLVYACELKPDTTAFILGSLGIIVSKINTEENINIKSLSFFIGIVFTGSAIIFKQQYIFFLAGLIIYALFFGNKKFKIFSILSLFLSMVYLFIFYTNKQILFWTVTVLSDDGILSYKQILVDHKLIFIYYSLFSIVLYIFYKTGFLKLNYLEGLINLKKLYKSSPWPLILTTVAIGAFLSALKVGGNAGNTAFGLVILMPIFFIFISGLNKNVAYLLLFFVIFLKIPVIFKNQISKYKEVLELNDFVEKNIKEKNVTILTGSNVYFIPRNIKNANYITNYWMYGIRDNIDIDKEFKILATKYRFDYLIVENFETNNEYIKNSSRYNLLFENKTAIIAKRK